MKRSGATALGLAVLAVLAGPVWAQEDAPRRARPERPGARRERPERGDRFAGLLGELKLTDKQRAPVEQIFQTYRQEMAQWLQQNGPAMRELYGKLRGGRGRDGQDAPKPSEADRKAAMEKLRELQKQRAGITENLLKQLGEHLTDEQMAVVRRRLGRGGRPGERPAGPPFWALGRLELTGDQRAKVREIVSAARRGAAEKDRPAVEQAMKDAWTRVEKEVLTDEQRARLKKILAAGPPRRGAAPGRGGDLFAGLDLTDKQKAALDEARAEMRRKMQEADPADRRKLFEQFREKIGQILTPEQMEKLQQRRREMMRREQPDRPQRGRRSRPGRGDAARVE